MKMEDVIKKIIACSNVFEDDQSVGTKERRKEEFVGRPKDNNLDAKKSKLGKQSAYKKNVIDEELKEINMINETIKKVVEKKKKESLPEPTEINLKPKLKSEKEIK